MRSRISVVIVILALFCSHLLAGYYEQELSLKRRWLFMIGDDPSYAEMKCDDSDWERVCVPESWEHEGFPGYDGYGWYRVHFILPEELNEKSLYLQLGKIDDVDETYINGKLIGKTGEFEPDYQTSWTNERIYELPKSILNVGGENVIAVRVYDHEGPGGIYHGKVGIYSKQLPNMVVEFTPKWKFTPGDNPDWAKMDWDDDGWDEIEVPSPWELQGYPLLDGFAWYRKTVQLPSNIHKGHLILSLGMIDDEDQVFFNGERIGSTGSLDSRRNNWEMGDNWKKERFYYIPGSLIKPGKKNVIAIRVYDRWGDGGLYQDQAGITTQKEYMSYRRGQRSSHRKVTDIIETIFDAIFD